MVDEQLITIKIINIQVYINYIFILEYDLFIITKIIYFVWSLFRPITARDEKIGRYASESRITSSYWSYIFDFKDKREKKSKRTKACN